MIIEYTNNKYGMLSKKLYFYFLKNSVIPFENSQKIQKNIKLIIN